MIADVFTMLVDLLNRPILTAAELAERLEISVRTVYRYVDVLSASGIPVVCRKGRGGGIMIGEDFKLHAQYLLPEEMQMIDAALDATPMRDSDAVVKIRSKLASISRETDRRLRRDDHFVVDSSESGNSDKLNAKTDALLKAKLSQTVAEISYHDRQGKVTRRKIEPYVIVYGDGQWYVYAYCRTRKDMRMFKISRITHIFNTGEPFCPRTFSTGWDLSDPAKESKKIGIVLKVDDDARYDVEEWLGVESVTASSDSGWIAQGVVSDNERTIDKILSFRQHVAVLSPASVKKNVTDSCNEILKRYR